MMTSEELRILILKMLRAVRSGGMTAKAVRVQVQIEERAISAEKIDESVQYLLDKGFVKKRRSRLSGEERLRISAEGVDILENEENFD